jgi:hypothetical protein
MSQQPTLWSDDRRWWWNGAEWRPANEFRSSSLPPPGVAAPRKASARLPLWIGGGIALVLVLVAVIGRNAIQPQPSDSFTVQGTGTYASQLFTLSGGSYKVSWQVQQTPMGANYPCFPQADLWNEAGYSQESLIWGQPGLGAYAVSPVTVRMPAGRWYIEVNNGCSDSQTVIAIERVGN